MAGLRGSPYVDMDDDGFIRLGELRRFTMREMAFTDFAIPTLQTTGGFSLNTVLSKRTGDPYTGRIGECVELIDEGFPYPRAHIFNERTNEVLVQDVGIGKSGRFGVGTQRWVPVNTTRQWKPERMYSNGATVRVKVWNSETEEYEQRPAEVTNFLLGVYEVQIQGRRTRDGSFERFDPPVPDFTRAEFVEPR